MTLHDKLKPWKIGHSFWKVEVVNKIPKEYKGSHSAVCDLLEKTIYIDTKYSKHEDCYLENLVHELVHAMDDHLSINQHDDVRRLLDKEKQIDNHEDLLVDQRAICLLDVIADNVENFEHLLAYFRGKKCKSSR